LLIGERTAEQIKIRIGSATKVDDDGLPGLNVKGRDLVTGLPKEVAISADEIRECLQEPISAIIETVKVTLEETPPELAADIMDKGIVLAGGGALLRGIDRLISNETGLPVHLADDPETCVARGTGKALEEMDSLRSILDTSTDAF